jgi:hypothetical protein
MLKIVPLDARGRNGDYINMDIRALGCDGRSRFRIVSNGGIWYYLSLLNYVVEFSLHQIGL